MSYIDLKYINMCSASLRNFKKQGTKFNCSCPICGDSQKKLSKARGYFLTKNGRYWFHCHNCQASLSLAYFLKKQFPLYYQEYILEKYKKTEETTVSTPSPVVQLAPLKKMSSTYATSIDMLSDDHYAKQYIKARLIPQDKFSLLYYTDDFAKLTEDLFPGQYTNLADNDPRIVLPFFDKSGDVMGLQGRSLEDSKLRYITARANKEVSLIYGMERLDQTKKVLVVEGPIDSLFLPNAIAVASSDLQRSLKLIPSINDYILIFDNEPRNKEIVKLIEAAIENDKTVCIWPSMYQEKDINDMVKAGHRQEDVLKSIMDNSFSGLRAKIKFTEWRKC